MGKNDSQPLAIHFDNPHRVYQAGAVVTGSVIYDVQEPQSSANLQLKLCGKATVAFSRDTGSKRRQHYLDNEIYVMDFLRLWPQDYGRGHGSQTLKVGHHAFPFTFLLPADVPSSFHCFPGNVRYYLKASLEGTGKAASVKEFFLVLRHLDLNFVPNARSPIQLEEEKNFSCMCCSSGHVSIRINLPKSAFVPGEAIRVHADIINNTSTTIAKTYFSIRQAAHCHAGGKTETVYKDLEVSTPRVEHPEIPPGGTDRWTGEEGLRVPMTIPTGLPGSSLIDMEHQLVLYVVPSGRACNAFVEMNIVIGTVPLRQGEPATADDRDNLAPSYSARSYIGEASRPSQFDGEGKWDSGCITSQV